MQISKKYVNIKSKSFDLMRRDKSSILVLTLYKHKKYSNWTAQFVKFAENYEMNGVKFSICATRKEQCRRFMTRVGQNKMRERSVPGIMWIQQSKESRDQFLYFLNPTKPELGRNDLLNWVLDVSTMRAEPAEISAPIPRVDDSVLVKEVVSATLDAYLLDAVGSDIGLLIYDSRECQRSCNEKHSKEEFCIKQKEGVQIGDFSGRCQEMLSRFRKIVEEARLHSGGKSADVVKYAYYDVGSNSSERLRLKKRLPVMRHYAAGTKKGYFDRSLLGSMKDFEEEVTLIMLKAAADEYAVSTLNTGIPAEDL